MSSIRENGRPFIRRVRIRNFRSIGVCDVKLADLTVLVGRNGAGKSNFLDALSFVTDGLQTSLDHAVKSRGGIDSVRRRSTGHPRNVAIELEVDLPSAAVATYGFEIAASGQGEYVVKREKLRIVAPSGEKRAHYSVAKGEILKSSPSALPSPTADRLYLVAASSLQEFRPVYEALLSSGFYNLNPEAMKELQSPDAGELLHREGGNIASVIARLADTRPAAFDRIRDYLQTIVPGVTDVGRVALGPKETLEFRQEVKGAKHPWKFYATSMSDGTLRALGALTAVTQLADRKHSVTLVGIEEPETALHPAAAGALVDALREAAGQTQVLLTSHSPDLLDQTDPNEDALLVVELREGTTCVAPVDEPSRKAIRDHLYTPGELLRMDQLQADEADVRRQQQQLAFLFADSDGVAD